MFHNTGSYCWSFAKYALVGLICLILCDAVLTRLWTGLPWGAFTRTKHFLWASPPKKGQLLPHFLFADICFMSLTFATALCPLFPNFTPEQRLITASVKEENGKNWPFAKRHPVIYCCYAHQAFHSGMARMQFMWMKVANVPLLVIFER